MPERSRRTCILLVLPFLTAIGSGSASAALVINEVLYDPEGPDAGREFVEIINTGPFAATLEGVVLEAGNGARPDDWSVAWSGSARTAIPPGGIYRIGAEGPGAGETAELRLQNGPDGVRLLKQGFELDRLGWGEHTFPGYYEGRPAPEGRSGQSLARKADGRDTDDNSADFAVAVPTPGRPNRPRTDWAVRFRSSSPEVPRPGEPVLVRVAVTNRGTGEALPPQIIVDDGFRPVLIGWDLLLAASGSVERAVLLDAPTDRDRVLWRARLLDGDEVPENDADSLCLRIGRGEVRITEVLSAPGAEGCEWIELRAEVPDGELLEGIVLELRGRRLALAPRLVRPETRIGLVVQDSAAMRGRFPDLEPASFWPYEGRWQRLRDGGRSAAISDTLRLRAPDGCLFEVAMPGPAPAAGVSLERIEADLPEGPAAWTPSTAPEGSSPGRDAGQGADGASGARLTVRPRVVHAGRSTCRLEGTVGARPGEVRLELVDLYGRTVRHLVRDLWVAGPVLATWDGRDDAGRPVAPGIYVAILEVSRPGGEIVRYRSPVAVAPGEER